MFARNRKLGLGFLGATTVYVLDESMWYRVVQRSLRAAGVGIFTIVNYKFLWSPENSSAVNSRVAQAITNCCLENEGLYVKIGQALNSMEAILPKEYSENLCRLLDKAKTYEYSVIKKIIDDELGSGVVGDIEEGPVGSASLAQVHRGRYLATGEVVAIKVQKPNVSMQAFWDLWMYRLLIRSLEWSFDIPLYWSVEFTTSHFMAELDFRLEGKNSELAREQLAELGEMVYVPKVVASTPKVLLTEWIDDTVMISNVASLKQRGFNCKTIVLDATKVFGFQIFHTGHVHCDPHFGNLLVRENPKRKGHHQIVLIDHGLYVDLPDKLRNEYARLWVAMAPPQDRAAVEEICAGWGVGSIDLFQAMIRQSGNQRATTENLPGIETIEPYHKVKRSVKETGVLVKDKLRQLLQDTSKFPKELILVGRCMNYIRAANWTHGSPIDRVAVLADLARSSASEGNISGKGWFLSGVNSVIRWLPGGSSYHKEIVNTRK